MRTEEFLKELKKYIYLGEYISDICFIYINKNFAPAVLCMNLEITKQGIIYKAISAIIYWDNDNKIIVRKNFDYKIQKEIGLPFKENFKYDDIKEKKIRNIEEKEYCLLMEKVCCELELNCITPSIKEKYSEILNIKDSNITKKLFQYFFPEATERLFN